MIFSGVIGNLKFHFENRFLCFCSDWDDERGSKNEEEIEGGDMNPSR